MLEMGATQGKMVHDTEKRIESLFDSLAANQIVKPVLAQLLHICQALKSRNLPEASKYTLNLMTANFDQGGKWVVGLKRLVELYGRV